MSNTPLERLYRKMGKDRDQTIMKSSAPGCPACEANRLHTPEDWKQFHPEAGTGKHKGHGAPLAQPTAPEATAPTLHDKEKPVE